MSIELEELLRKPLLMESFLLKKSFYDFVKFAWNEVETDEFVEGWYIQALCNYFEAVYDGRIQNLIINQPPRTLKTLISGVFFPCWVWGKNPKKRFIFASYSLSLAVDASIKCRKLLTSSWYMERFPKTVLYTKKEDLLITWDGGHRLSIGVDGPGTGRGADIIVCDDILKASDAYSDLIRENTNRWFDETISTRRNNLRESSIILIGQRLHENDIFGHVLDKNPSKWEQLILPMEYDGIRFTSSIGFVDPRKEMGESLHPQRFAKEDIDDLKIALGPYATPGQLQQRPVAIEGSIFKESWFSNRADNYDVIYRFLSFDTAGTANKNSAFSSCVVGELTHDYRLFVREVWRDKIEFPQLLEAIKAMIAKYPKLDAILIENKSSGTQAVQSLQQSLDEWIAEMIVPINVPANNSKEQRAFSAVVWCEQGCILLPPKNSENYPWLLDFEDELFKFPSSKYKDQVDAFTQLINFLTDQLAEGLKFRKGGV